MVTLLLLVRQEKCNAARGSNKTVFVALALLPSLISDPRGSVQGENACNCILKERWLPWPCRSRTLTASVVNCFIKSLFPGSVAPPSKSNCRQKAPTNHPSPQPPTANSVGPLDGNHHR
ncbi:hypothetical protein BDZ45DRAFT_354139 [Acephala macrosclerotiorum]|nr:hypothetical protein BDZ45DRAFT_354139 [Acephala macrosclerotiorum]